MAQQLRFLAVDERTTGPTATGHCLASRPAMNNPVWGVTYSLAIGATLCTSCQMTDRPCAAGALDRDSRVPPQLAYRDGNHSRSSSSACSAPWSAS